MTKGKRRAKLERTIENNCVKHAVERGCLHYKLDGLGRRSKPDQLFVTPNGYAWFVEFKRPGEDLTPLQENERRELVARRQLHSQIDNETSFQLMLEWLLQRSARKVPCGW